jgi:hypothetical protein
MASLLVWNALIGLGHLMSVLGEQTAVARSGSTRLDSAFGTYTFVGSLGQAAAPALLAVIGGAAIVPDTGRLVLCYTAACVLMLALTVVLRPGRSGAAAAGVVPLPLRTALRVPADTRRTMTGAMLLSMLVLAAVDLIQVYLPALGVERRIPASTIGILLALRAAATMVSRLGLARLSRRFGRVRLVVASTLVAGCAVAAIAVPVPPVVLGLTLVVAGLALGIGQPLSMSIVTLAAPPGTVSTWLAMRLSANRLGQSLIPALLSAVALGVGTGGIFVVTGGALFGTAALARAMLPPDP